MAPLYFFTARLKGADEWMTWFYIAHLFTCFIMWSTTSWETSSCIVLKRRNPFTFSGPSSSGRCLWHGWAGTARSDGAAACWWRHLWGHSPRFSAEKRTCFKFSVTCSCTSNIRKWFLLHLLYAPALRRLTLPAVISFSFPHNDEACVVGGEHSSP